MNSKRILGIILLVVGLVMIGASYYIKDQVAKGNLEIHSAQKKVDTANSLFSLNPVSKEVGKGITGSAQRQIDEGRQQVTDYTVMANRLQIGGIILAIIGLVLIFFSGKRRN